MPGQTPSKPKVEVKCPYCEAEAKLVDGKTIYPHRPDLHAKKFWECEPCDAYVGCHPNTDKPMGRLATLALRQWKMKVHAHFDLLWKNEEGKKKYQARSAAYVWLAGRMGIPVTDCHIGMFSEEQCAEALRILEAREAS